MMRRRTIARAISIAEVPNPLSIETQAIQAIETRPLLQAAIEAQKYRLEEAELQAARTFATETQVRGRVEVERAFQSSQAAKQSEEQIKQRTEALTYINEKLNKHTELLKTNYPDAVGAALDLRVEALESGRSQNETAGKGIAEEIKSLKAERSKLTKSSGPKAAS